jgi:hypothetical protein
MQHPFHHFACGLITAITVTIATADDSVDYTRDVKPIFQSRCYACHGGLKQESKLRLDTGKNILLGGESGAIVTAGNANDSELLKRISATDLSIRMPPEGEPLRPVQVAILQKWIVQGAVIPADEQPEQDPRSHWSFRSPVKAPLPNDGPAWVGNPIDAFIAEKHQANRLTAQTAAPRELLLRRVYLDLVGFPPSREELQSDLANTAPNAYEQVVDRLLASPQYGERWARHWMDIWRYADWHGRRMVPDVWNSAPQIWRWRDWIVRSLNEDKGYDRMLVEMLAADEVDPENEEATHATGYLIRNWYALNPNDWMRSIVEHTGKAFLGLTFNCAHCHDHKYDPITQDDYFRLRAFFEPIGVRQDRLAGEADPGPFQEYSYSTLRKVVRHGAVRVYDKTAEAPTWFYTGGDERNRLTDRGAITPGLPAFLTSWQSTIQPVKLPTPAWYPGLKPAIQETVVAERRAAIAQAQSQLTAARTAADAALPALRQKLAQAIFATLPANELLRDGSSIPEAVGAIELQTLQLKSLEAKLDAVIADLASVELRITADKAKYGSSSTGDAQTFAAAASRAERSAALRMAEAEVLAKEHQLAAAQAKPASDANRAKGITAAEKPLAAARGELEKARTAMTNPPPAITYTSLTPVYPSTSTGRRRALANWIASRENPLTARVGVNHIWARHFHAPLVTTVYDFGRNGHGATHPELLDWLAVQWMESGWSMKQLHRFIVTSEAYRMSSNAHVESSSLATGEPPQSLDPENKFLWRMNVGRMESEVLRDTLLNSAGRLDFRMGGQELENSQALTTYRRTLYYCCQPELDGKSEFGALFDAPEALECYRRTRSVVPQQALALTNSELIHELSSMLAAALWDSIPAAKPSDSDKFVMAAYEQILSRRPTNAELQICVKFLAPAATETPTDPARDRASLVRALLNHNDFIAIR